MGLLITESLSEETALDRADPWASEREEYASLFSISVQDDEDEHQTALGEQWERPFSGWLGLRLGALRELTSHEA